MYKLKRFAFRKALFPTEKEKEETILINVSSTSLKTRMLIESAILIAIAAVLNEFASFKASWAFGGSITFGSMIPLALICWRWGTKQGLFSAFAFAFLQLILGVSNVAYGQTPLQMAAIALLDYLVAYSVYGLAAIFRGKDKNETVALASGIVFSGVLRFVCHFLSGWMIWDALWPNDKGMSGALYSLAYNGGYMLPDILIAVAIALLSYPMLKKFWARQN